MLNRRILSLAALTIAIAGCASVPTPVSVADTIAKEPSLSTLAGLQDQSGLSSTLRGTGPYTVFAPSNEAFKAVNAKTMEQLKRDPEQLKAVLSFHVVAQRLKAAELKNSSVASLNGAKLALSRAGDFVTVEEAVAQRTDIQASNGVIHIIDSVLTPAVKK